MHVGLVGAGSEWGLCSGDWDADDNGLEGTGETSRVVDVMWVLLGVFIFVLVLWERNSLMNLNIVGHAVDLHQSEVAK